MVKFLKYFGINPRWYQSKQQENLAYILFLNFSLMSGPLELYCYLVLGFAVS